MGLDNTFALVQSASAGRRPAGSSAIVIQRATTFLDGGQGGRGGLASAFCSGVGAVSRSRYLRLLAQSRRSEPRQGRTFCRSQTRAANHSKPSPSRLAAPWPCTGVCLCIADLCVSRDREPEYADCDIGHPEIDSSGRLMIHRRTGATHAEVSRARVLELFMSARTWKLGGLRGLYTYMRGSTSRNDPAQPPCIPYTTCMCSTPRPGNTRHIGTHASPIKTL